jgi:hypothetical protein
MTQANIKYLEDHRNVVDEIVNAQTATRANAIKGELLRIMQEEFLPGYVILDSCGSCLFDLVRQLYRRFDEWKAQNMATLEKVKASFPAATKEVKPKHHKRR